MRGLALNKKTHLYSHKRGKKTEESPFAAKERISQSNRTENHSEVWNSKLWNATGIPSGQQGLKQFFQNQFGHLQPVNQALRKTNSGLCYCEVCKVTRWHVFNFLCSDWSLCTVEFKINKVFDFKINQKLCFLLINYNGNEPDFWWWAVQPI